MYYLQQYFDETAPVYEATATIEAKLQLCRELFSDELRAGLAILGVDGFLSYKDVNKLDALVLFPIIHLLELFYTEDPSNAQLAANDMIEVLVGLDTDDDTFPEYEVYAVRKAPRLKTNPSPEE